MANGHGGARPGAGRKAKEQKFEGEIAAAERQIADRLPTLIDNLLELAGGGYEIVEERWEPAGMQFRDDYEPVDDTGKTRKTRVQVFPDLDPDTMVLVQRVVSIANRDRSANIYLLDRILGRPTERQEIDASLSGQLQVTEIVVNKTHEKPVDG